MASEEFKAYYDEISLFKFPSGETINIVPQVLEINVYESLFEPFVKVEMTVYDSIGLFSNFPLTGDEVVKISYNLENDKVSRIFYTVIERLDNISISDDNRNMVYVMQCVSIEAWQNARTAIQQAYNGTIPGMVRDIYNQHIERPLKNVIPSYNSPLFRVTDDDRDRNQVLVVPNLNPFKIINILADRATDNVAELTYFFYANARGFWFRPLQDMFQRGNRFIRDEVKENKYKYISDEIETSNIMNNEGRLVTSITMNKRLSSLDQIAMGYYQNKYFEINPAQKAYHITEKRLSDADGKFISGNTLARSGYSNQVPLGNQGDQTEESNYIKYDLTNNPENNQNMPVKLTRESWGTSLISMVAMSQIDLSITIPGNLNLYVGDLFYLETPEMHGFVDNREDPFLSGFYLITEKRDTITQQGELSTSLRIQKDSYESSVDIDSKYNTEKGIPVLSDNNSFIT